MRRRRRSLQYVGLHPRTLRAYRTALDRFLKFLKKKHLDIRSPSRLDRRLAEFIDMAYQEGEPISYAGHLLSAIKRFHPPMRMKLPTSSQYYRNWQRAYQPTRAVPASWDLVEALMGVAFHRGEPYFALLLAIGFNCLLRTSEMLSLTHRHVVFHQEHTALSIVLPGSKTSQGNPQVILIRDQPLIDVTLLGYFLHGERMVSGDSLAVVCKPWTLTRTTTLLTVCAEEVRPGFSRAP